jgi:hypothetical protein
MKRKKVWRYYCEHCKKSGCSGGHIKKHETGCTLNPDRVCKMCSIAEEEQRPMASLIAVFAPLKAVPLPDNGLGVTEYQQPVAELEAAVKKLDEMAGGCPACMLAAARLGEKASPGLSIDIDFARRRREFWDDRNEAEAARECRG